MLRQRFSILRHASVLPKQCLDSIEAIRSHHATVIKTQRARRDVLRIETLDETGKPLTLFIKRNCLSYGHNERMSLLRRGRILGVCEAEADNLAVLQRIGVCVSPCVAVGSQTTWIHERFSCIVTEAVPGQPLDEWLNDVRDPQIRWAVLKELARIARHIHDRNYALPSLMARHVFVEFDGEVPRLALIDVDRLPRGWRRWCRRSKDLTILHFSIAACVMGPRERLRFLSEYAGRRKARSLLWATLRRSNFVLLNRKERAIMYLRGLDRPSAEHLLAQARDSRARAPFRQAMTAAMLLASLTTIMALIGMTRHDGPSGKTFGEPEFWLERVGALQQNYLVSIMALSLAVLATLVMLFLQNRQR